MQLCVFDKKILPEYAGHAGGSFAVLPANVGTGFDFKILVAGEGPVVQNWNE